LDVHACIWLHLPLVIIDLHNFPRRRVCSVLVQVRQRQQIRQIESQIRARERLSLNWLLDHLLLPFSLDGLAHDLWAWDKPEWATVLRQYDLAIVERVVVQFTPINSRLRRLERLLHLLQRACHWHNCVLRHDLFWATEHGHEMAGLRKRD
jgi:hypothetical protein